MQVCRITMGVERYVATVWYLLTSHYNYNESSIHVHWCDCNVHTDCPDNEDAASRVQVKLVESVLQDEEC
jgi:hypothetical protein